MVFTDFTSGQPLQQFITSTNFSGYQKQLASFDLDARERDIFSRFWGLGLWAGLVMDGLHHRRHRHHIIRLSWQK
ncbi:uncharacterized protein ACLA_063980 [Aspergillus clavatus NRRL 1]|uniref:Uncharacterized protein n=1 Tax=Aspergillus clavatus (strain ATCC 1007 / CBS 513.65 / DSM 816 / NCTC 3887 / NRRL 1 / QM 1276 / 107) TaxID=344612 RepID=A1CD20_ASPCL|nr:uncharacterized protein ACLA_063980 [Aspergillus clavatus NRRL 1]EAW12427.1 hypothetical protein ACLA_063980 [Aspergillus clavatus NRRL 1]